MDVLLTPALGDLARIVVATVDGLHIVHVEGHGTSPRKIDSVALEPRPLALTAVLGDEPGLPDVAILREDGSIARLPGSAIRALAEGGASPAEAALVQLVPGAAPVTAPARLVSAPVSGRGGGDLIVLQGTRAGMAAARFVGERGQVEWLEHDAQPTAAVAMRLGTSALRKVLVARRGRVDGLDVIGARTRGTFVVNDNDDLGDHAPDGVCETAPGNGECTLRAALEEANAATGPHEIHFSGLIAGDHTITPRGELLAIREVVTIDGTTHPDGMVEIEGLAAGPASGLQVESDFVTLRGLAVFDFHWTGITLVGTGNVVEGCRVGTNIAGDSGLGNATGIRVDGRYSSENTIGGPAQAARTVVSGNGGSGVYFADSRMEFNAVQGCYVGTTVAGAGVLGNNDDGIQVSSHGTLIGGSAPGEGNVISGNSGDGIEASGYWTWIWNNRIGTDASGTLDLGNGWNGVKVVSSDNVRVGGLLTGAEGNVISGNGRDGVSIETSDATGAWVVSNIIGADITGTVPLGNASHGVDIRDWPTGTVVGGATQAARNVISANVGGGVFLDRANGTVIQGNAIGTDLGGTIDLGNSSHGVSIRSSSSVAVGGAGPGEGNTIAFNGGDGVVVIDGVFNSIRGSAIHDNAQMAIDLGNDGRTPNDPGDPDTGANRLMNFPEISSAEVGPAGRIVIEYRVDCDQTSADYPLAVELFVADTGGAGGRRIIGTDTWTLADLAAGTRTVEVEAGGLTLLDRIVATATDDDGNTSELGDVAAVSDPGIFSDGFESGDTSAWAGAMP